jgi:hypothetical protein
MQANFVYHFLIEKGIPRQRIRINKCPPGKQAGERYVRQNYPKEVKAIRSKRRLHVGLVTVIDADIHTVDERLAQLAQEIADSEQEGRGQEEPIAILVPKRNIETWIYHLLGHQVNEEEKYNNHVKVGDAKPAARKFAVRCPDRLSNDCPSSMRTGCEEIIEFLRKSARD